MHESGLKLHHKGGDYKPVPFTSAKLSYRKHHYCAAEENAIPVDINCFDDKKSGEQEVREIDLPVFIEKLCNRLYLELRSFKMSQPTVMLSLKELAVRPIQNGWVFVFRHPLLVC
jgi:hypothetical protein